MIIATDKLAELFARTKLEEASPQDEHEHGWTPPRPHKRLVTQQRPLRYLLVMDVEATCDAETERFRHELIELPVILLDLQTGEMIATFHRFVRPTKQPQLSEFCRQLTGISQATVDAADPFPVVLQELTAWLEHHTADRFDPPLHAQSILKPPAWYPRTTVQNDHRLQRDFRNWAFATDGLADLEKFMWLQGVASHIPLPTYFQGPYVDTRGLAAAFLKRPRATLAEQLRQLGLEAEGQAHSGLADSRNIARICLTLAKRGCIFEPNRVFYRGHKAWIQHQRYKPFRNFPST